MKLFKRKNKEKEKNKTKVGIVIKNVTSMGYFSERKWDTYTKKEKRAIFLLCLVLLAAVAGCAFYYHYAPFIHQYFLDIAAPMEHPIEKWLVEHIPSLFDTVLTIIFFGSVFYLVKCFRNTIRFKSQKAKTISNLIFSIITYILFITGLLIIFYSWGADTATMIASASVLTLIAGLGAQSLVEDFIAGVVIAIEGDFQVGDLVILDDFIGTVREIGSRVTKIENLNNHIKIVRNSEINQIINTSKEHSYNEMTFEISKSFSLEQIDELFVSNLERIKKASYDVDELKYVGLITFNDSTVTYCLAFTSKNNCSLQNKVLINKEVYKILKENKIS